MAQQKGAVYPVERFEMSLLLAWKRGKDTKATEIGQPFKRTENLNLQEQIEDAPATYSIRVSRSL